MSKNITFILFFMLPGLNAVSIASVQDCKDGDYIKELCQRETLTEGLFGLCPIAENSGLEFALGSTLIYQQDGHGGISTHRKAGRFSGSYDIEISGDMQKLLGIEGGSFYMLSEGSFSDGIDGYSVGSHFGVNGDAGGYRSLDITELWYQQSFADDKWRIRIGKIDLTCGIEHHNCPVGFDCSMFANDETSQFLNNALINNPTIPFADNGLGIVSYLSLTEHCYFSVGAADAQADARETGFRTAFYGEDYFFYIAETGLTPHFDSANGQLQGAYRAGMWYDPQPKANSDSEKYYRDDRGLYLTFDQMLYKENADANDTQGLGAFFRYGYASGKTNDIADFWSTGFQYQGLFAGRDNDVLGVGYARGFFSDRASLTYTEDYESVIETYYNMQITPWVHVTPSVQYITNPGGSDSAKDATVFAIRVQMAF